jgi:hypothetical protein
MELPNKKVWTYHAQKNMDHLTTRHESSLWLKPFQAHFNREKHEREAMACTLQVLLGESLQKW